MQVGRLHSLIQHLPVDSVTAAAQQDLPSTAWSRTEQLLALVLESQDLGHRIQMKVWGGKRSKDPEPVRIEWPGRREAEKPRRRPSTKAEIAAFLGKGRLRVVRDADGS